MDGLRGGGERGGIWYGIWYWADDSGTLWGGFFRYQIYVRKNERGFLRGRENFPWRERERERLKQGWFGVAQLTAGFPIFRFLPPGFHGS